MKMKVKTNPFPSPRIDIRLYNPKRLFGLVEVTNEWIHSHYDSKRTWEKYKRFLKFKRCLKLYICSFRSSIKDPSFLERQGVKIIEIGFQTLPLSYYNFFAKKENSYIQERKVDDPQSLKLTERAVWKAIKGTL